MKIFYPDNAPAKGAFLQVVTIRTVVIKLEKVKGKDSYALKEETRSKNVVDIGNLRTAETEDGKRYYDDTIEGPEFKVASGSEAVLVFQYVTRELGFTKDDLGSRTKYEASDTYVGNIRKKIKDSKAPKGAFQYGYVFLNAKNAALLKSADIQTALLAKISNQDMKDRLEEMVARIKNEKKFKDFTLGKTSMHFVWDFLNKNEVIGLKSLPAEPPDPK